MIEQDIVNYIILAQKHGLSELEIKQNLLSAGWQAGAVEENFIHAKALLDQSGAVRMPETKMPDNAVAARFATDQSSTLNQITITTATGPVEAGAAFSASQGAIAQNSSPNLVSQPEKKNFFKKPLFWAPVIIVLALAATAYGYYALVYANPAKVWSKFTKNIQSPIYNTQFNFTYTDQTQATGSSSSLLGLNLSDINLTFAGNTYINATNPDNPQSNSKIQYTFGSGNTNFSTGLQYMLIDNVLYLNVGSNPFLDMVSASLNNGQKIDWLKIDLNEAKTQAGQSADSAKIYQQLTSPDFKNQIQKIWNDTTIIKEDKYLGQQKINGATTLHFQNSVDKAALKGLVNQYVQVLSKTLNGSSAAMSAQDAAYANQLAAQLIDKIQVKEFQTWIGLFDGKLYRVHLVTNAPSFISLINNAQTLSLGSSNDAKRIVDVRQMASAFELYYNDNNGYPDGQGGKPLGLTPAYIGLLPAAPAPDGNCTGYFNTYWYTPEGTKTVVKGKTVYSSYQMTFCLGSATGAYQAGIGQLSPSGIKDNITCPSSNPANCAKAGSATDQNAQIEQQATDFVNKLDFGAEVKADVDYTDYGKTQTLTAPTGAFDVLKVMQDAQGKSADAKRIADVRQLATAMELYFNDFNSYPPNLAALASKYIGVVPTAPTPAGGSCPEADNTYTYKYISPTGYQLTFCLGNITGGYAAGKHTLTQAGIQ